MIKKTNIIMPVHNRPEHTEQSITSLFANTNNSLFDLWVVDDVSDVETRELLERLYNKYNFFLDRNLDNIGPAVSRNSVCDCVERMDYLYHSDNDVYFTKGWLEKLTGVYEEVKKQGVLLLGGGCHPYLQNNRIIPIKIIITDDEEVFNVDVNVGIKDAVSGYSQLMSWDVWDKYGPFDEGSRGLVEKISSSEDWAFCQRIVKDGFLVGSIEPEVVIHTGRTNTYNKPAIGYETIKNVEGVKVL